MMTKVIQLKARAFVQTNNKWYAFQLNSKFDKTENFIEVLSQFDIERNL